jgi:hypothetical protein
MVRRLRGLGVGFMLLAAGCGGGDGRYEVVATGIGGGYEARVCRLDTRTGEVACALTNGKRRGVVIPAGPVQPPERPSGG